MAGVLSCQNSEVSKTVSDRRARDVRTQLSARETMYDRRCKGCQGSAVNAYGARAGCGVTAGRWQAAEGGERKPGVTQPSSAASTKKAFHKPM